MNGLGIVNEKIIKMNIGLNVHHMKYERQLQDNVIELNVLERRDSIQILHVKHLIHQFVAIVMDVLH